MSRLTFSESVELLKSGDLPLLGKLAGDMTERIHPGNVRTYNVERNINYTNICISGCRFCAFHRSENDADAYVIDEQTLLDKIEETVQLGGRQILLQGGLHPSLPFSWYENLLRTVKRHYPDVNIHGFSPTEIVYFSDRFGMSERDILLRLRDAGLGSIPGGGAEILVDRVRHIVSPKKATADRWLNVCRLWFQFGGRGSATMMLGHLETLEERVEHLQRIRDVQDEVLTDFQNGTAATAGFTAFIPWTFQPGNTQLADITKTGSWEYLQFLAVSRLFLDNVTTIQSSWVTQGLTIGTLGLSFGANDLGSIMIEENVVAAAGTVFRSTEKAFCESIRSAGYEPQRRRTGN
ncbi:MAG: dehypoxanthine futalosine cyclase [Planctomycetaceae bacterium]|jgi:cyclic dehypoxanthinyl futalosine synthase|nr:dehypoxanthine futalosine cyclase [Planctomycetaceae bacterium]